MEVLRHCCCCRLALIVLLLPKLLRMPEMLLPELLQVPVATAAVAAVAANAERIGRKQIIKWLFWGAFFNPWCQAGDGW